MSARSCLEAQLPLPAYDQCMIASHAFNTLDARKAISVTERQNYILKVRELAQACAVMYKEQEKWVKKELGAKPFSIFAFCRKLRTFTKGWCELTKCINRSE